MARLILIFSILLLGGCIQQASTRIAALVLVPFVLILAVMWLLNRNRSGDEPWEDEHYPDQDEDEDEDHHLM